ncbi:MAG: hypothetical protein ACYC35_26970 [Pirellulales bacterium]
MLASCGRGLWRLLAIASGLVWSGTALAASTDWAAHPENVWVQQSPRDDAPSPRYLYEGSGAWDGVDGKFIRWGGHDGIPQGFQLFLWDLQTGKWQQRFPNTSPPGACCVDGANVFDLANRCFVRFPGASMNHGHQWFRKVQLKNSHAWLYDPATNTWTNMRPAPYRQPEKYSREVLGSLNAGGTYDENHEVAISFGGQGTAGGMNNLFVYDAYANQLERLDAANPPSPRDGMGVCYDTKNDCLVTFGSQYADDERTWIYRYDANRWEALDLRPAPPGKKRGTYSTIPKMAFDSANGVCLCMVWLEDQGGMLQTWILDLAQRKWTRMSPPNEPGPTGSRARNLGYDRALNLFFLEGVDPKGQAHLWTYRYRKAPAEEIAPPVNLVAATDAGAVRLTWTAAAGAKEYRVYRAELEKPWKTRFAKLAAAAHTSYEDRDQAAGRVYVYTVRAVADDGRESRPSLQARTQPRVVGTPVVSVLAANKVEVTWPETAAKDIAGYNVYRGVVAVDTNTTSRGAWGANDPDYPEPVVDRVRDITELKKLNDAPLAACRFLDTGVDLNRKPPQSADYRWAVHAYIVRAVNRLGTQSGPSPYALTIPAEPQNVLAREDGRAAVLKWDPSREQGIAGYRVYRIDSKAVTRLGQDLLKETTLAIPDAGHARYAVVAIDALGQEGQPSSPAWCGQSYQGFFDGPWHQ